MACINDHETDEGNMDKRKYDRRTERKLDQEREREGVIRFSGWQQVVGVGLCP